METKFLSDGRKVVVVGALNNQETIVQKCLSRSRVMKSTVASVLW